MGGFSVMLSGVWVSPRAIHTFATVLLSLLKQIFAFLSFCVVLGIEPRAFCQPDKALSLSDTKLHLHRCKKLCP